MTLATITSQAQVPQLPPELIRNQLRVRGDSITYCLNEQSFFFELEETLARELSDALLVDPIFYRYSHRDPPRPYDYSLSVDLDDLYFLLVNECDVFMSLSLTGDTDTDWLRLTEPLFTTHYVVAVRSDAGYSRLAEVPAGAIVGARLMSQGHLDFGTLNRLRAEHSKWRLLPYNDHQILFERLLDGTVQAAVIWEPALMRLTADQAVTGVTAAVLDPSPFSPRELSFSFGLLSRNGYLVEELDSAIAVLRDSGELAEILGHHLHDVVGD